jgi:hypothetical protein
MPAPKNFENHIDNAFTVWYYFFRVNVFLKFFVNFWLILAIRAKFPVIIMKKPEFARFLELSGLTLNLQG